MEPGLILEVARRACRSLSGRASASGEFAIQCPTPQRHRHGDSHPSCRLNADKNTWYCDVCGRGGGVIDLARELDVDMSTLSLKEGAMRRSKTKQPKGDTPILRFVSSGRITAATQTWFRDHLGKSYPESAWHAVGVLEGTLDGDPAIAFPQPSGGFKVCLYQRPDRKHGKPYSWKFTDDGKSDLLVVGDSPEVLLVAGEWDMLAALAAGIPSVATGTGGEGTWKSTWSSQLAGKRILVVYDVDDAGRQGAIKVVAALTRSAARVVNVALPLSGNPEIDGKDLSDFLAVHSPAELHTLLTQASSLDAGRAGFVSNGAPVSELIDAILSVPGPIRLKRRDAAKLVINDLRERGELVQAAGGRLFWYDRQDKRLFDLDAFQFRCLFLKHFQINPAEREYAHVFEAVKAVAREEGRRVHVVRFSFYDLRTHCLYVDGGLGRILRLDGASIQVVDNGTDDVLFEDAHEHEIIPPESLTITSIVDAIHELIIGRVNFTRGSGVILGPEQQRLIFRIWILAIFFPERMPARVLLLLYGEKGSGKTTTLRAVLKLLLGPQANVTPLGKEDGFNAAVSTEYLLVFDNVDSFCKWIEDRLATVATGQTIRMRKLYTTNEMLSFPTRCAIALTARTPRFRRDDVVDRLQILRVARLDTFAKESDWYQEIEVNRARLWAQLLRELNAVVASLRTAQTDSPDTIRMADWASLAAAIGDSLGQGPETRAALEAAELDKAHFLLEADEVYDLLHALAHERPDSEWRAGDLFAELKRRAEHADVEFTIKSPRSLGRILHRLQPALKLMIRFKIAADDHDKQAVYTLGPLREDDGSQSSRPPDPADDPDV